MPMALSMDLPTSTAATADPDLALLERVAGGDRRALDELLQRHAETMWRVALRFCGGRAADAEDVVQEACLACLGSARQYAGRGSVRSWILAVTAHAARRHLRAAQRRSRHESQAPAPQPGPEPSTDEAVLREAACTGLAQLDEGFRQVLELRYLDGLDDAAIAATLGLREATVRTRSHRGLSRLRDWLGRRGFAVGAAAVVAALTPAQAATVPVSLPSLISAAAATGKGTVIALGTSWSLGKLALAAVTALAVTVGGAWMLRPDPRLVLDGQELVTTPMDTVLAQSVTLHLDRVGVPVALEALRASLSLAGRPDVIAPPILDRGGAYDPDEESEILALSCTVAADGLPLREVLDRLCASAGLRWWAGAGALVIDLPSERRRVEDAAFLGRSDADTARILIESADALALRPLLLALADDDRRPAASAALATWMDRQVRFNRGRTILTRFAEDADVHAALAAAIRADALPRAVGIHLAGQIRLPGIVTGCLTLVEAGRRPRDPVEQLLGSSLRQDLGVAAVRALGWYGDGQEVEPLLALVADTATEAGLRRIAIQALGDLGDPRAVPVLMPLIQAKDPFSFVADAALHALIDLDDPRVLPLLGEVVKDPAYSWPERRTATLVLGHRGGMEALAVLAEAAAVAGADARIVHGGVAEALVCHEGPVADAILLDLLARREAGYEARASLAKRRRPTLFPVLAQRLRTEPGGGDSYAHLVRAIATLGGSEAEELLLDTMPVKTLRGRFWAHCGALAGVGPRANAALIALADDDDVEVRRIVALFLVHAGDEGRDRLWRLIDEDDDAEVRCRGLACCDLRNDRGISIWPSSWWDRWLSHRHADVRAEAARQVASNPRAFAEAEWLGRMGAIIADAAGEVRAAGIQEPSGWSDLYARDPDRWRASLSLLRTDPVGAVRLTIAKAAFYLTFPSCDLSRSDQGLLLDRLVETVESDVDPQVRAQAGVTLGRILRVCGESLSIRVGSYLDRLRVCAAGDAEERVRRNLQRVLTDAEPLHVDLDWKGNPPAESPPPVEAADDF